MLNEKMERTVFWMPKSLLAIIDSQLEESESKNSSDYVRKAVAFYSGFRSSKKADDYLSQALLGELDKRLKKNEAHISKTIFRLAVELAMTMHLIAAQIEVLEDVLDRLRKRCVRDVKSSNGRMKFDDAYMFQHGNSEEVFE